MSDAGVGGENISKYWKDFYGKRPDLLPLRSNDEAIAQWRADHGGSEIPANVLNGLTNVKSHLRTAGKVKKKRGRPRKHPLPGDVTAAPAATRVVKAPSKLLETLEDQIDVCLGLIGGQEELGKITAALKHARRLAIMHMGI